MSRFDDECEFCGKEGRTICIGALRLCQSCLKRRLRELNSRRYSLSGEREYKTLDDCALECGNYYNLTSMLYFLGEMTGCDVNNMVEILDDIFDRPEY